MNVKCFNTSKKEWIRSLIKTDQEDFNIHAHLISMCYLWELIYTNLFYIPASYCVRENIPELQKSPTDPLTGLHNHTFDIDSRSIAVRHLLHYVYNWYTKYALNVHFDSLIICSDYYLLCERNVAVSFSILQVILSIISSVKLFALICVHLTGSQPGCYISAATASVCGNNQ